MSSSSAIRIICPTEFDKQTARCEASDVTPQSRPNSASNRRGGAAYSLGFVTMASNRPSQTSCRASANSVGGANGKFAACAKVDDFDNVPTFLPHMEINPSISHSAHGTTRGDRQDASGRRVAAR
jgi:hypothetical protein